MKTYRIATVPGDGIGKEVVPAGRRVLEVLAGSESSFTFEFENFDWGGDYFRQHGEMMPESGLNALKCLPARRVLLHSNSKTSTGVGIIFANMGR